MTCLVRLFTLYVIFFHTNLLFCQSDFSLQKNPPEDAAINITDTSSVNHLGYIWRNHNLLTLRLDANAEPLRMEFKKVLNGKDIILSPNTNVYTRFMVGYKKINLGFSFAPKVAGLNEASASKGETKVTGLELKINLKQSQTFVRYQKIKGYYLANAYDFQDALQYNNHPFNDLALKNLISKIFAIESLYYFNTNKYSYRFLRDRNEIQLKSGGSWFGIASYYYNALADKDKELRILLDSTQATQQMPNRYIAHDFLAGVGYGYNWILPHHFYIGTLTYLAAGLHYISNNQELNNNANNTQASAFFSHTLNVGYSDPKWFMGFSMAGSSYSNFASESQTLSGNRLYLMGFLGYRWDTKKRLSRTP